MENHNLFRNLIQNIFKQAHVERVIQFNISIALNIRLLEWTPSVILSKNNFLHFSRYLSLDF